jgi:hypothetical protein
MLFRGTTITTVLLAMLAACKPLRSAASPCNLCACGGAESCSDQLEWLVSDTEISKEEMYQSLKRLYAPDEKELCSGLEAGDCLSAVLEHHRSIGRNGRLAALQLECAKSYKSLIVDGCEATDAGLQWKTRLRRSRSRSRSHGSSSSSSSSSSSNSSSSSRRRLSIVGHFITAVLTVVGFASIIFICWFLKYRMGYMSENGFVPIPVSD